MEPLSLSIPPAPLLKRSLAILFRCNLHKAESFRDGLRLFLAKPETNNEGYGFDGYHPSTPTTFHSMTPTRTANSWSATSIAAIRRTPCRTVVWSRPPRNSPI